MTTIYIPQRIETAEQAAALPNGTIAIEPDTEADRFSLMRVTYDGLECWITDKKIYTIDFPVGWTALVPTTAVHDLANELSNSGDRGWLSPIGDELLELLAGINNR